MDNTSTYSKKNKLCPCKSLEQHDRELLEGFAEEIKKLFYTEFDEIIPSIMADKIDNLLKERGIADE